MTETSTPSHKKLELRGRASLSPLAVGLATGTISKRRIAPVMARMQASARHCESYQISCLVVTSYPTFQILSTSALNSTISDHGYRHLYPRASPSVLLHGILVQPVMNSAREWDWLDDSLQKLAINVSSRRFGTSLRSASG